MTMTNRQAALLAAASSLSTSTHRTPDDTITTRAENFLTWLEDVPPEPEKQWERHVDMAPSNIEVDGRPEPSELDVGKRPEPQYLAGFYR